MKKAPGSATPVLPRKAPKQRRSTETIAVIVEAAARILEGEGFAAFNTNAVAERAGVSIGSLYQYFPSKHALLAALIEREMSPLTNVEQELEGALNFSEGMQAVMLACVRNQMRRPELARLMDQAEKLNLFDEQVSQTVRRLHKTMEGVLKLPGAPRTRSRSATAADLIAIIKSLTDAAGERSERESQLLLERISGAIDGYLSAVGA